MANPLITTIGSKELHQHQRTAVQWMIEREADAVASGGLVCDEMGLGKTFTAIGLMVNRPVRQTLVLGPLAVIQQWVAALKQTDFSVYEIQKHRWTLVHGSATDENRVFVTNYDKTLSSPNLFKLRFGRVVCDEAHILRNIESRKTKCVSELHRSHTWLLTGTPIVNRANDLATLVSLFHRGVKGRVTPSLRDATTWMQTYAICRTTEQLRDIITAALPKRPKVFMHNLAFSTEDEAIFYRGIQGRVAAQLERLMEQDKPNMIIMLQLLLRLRQISVHPQVYINAKRRQMPEYMRANWEADSTKTERIVEILRSQTDQKHGYVVFCNFSDEIQLLAERLRREDCVGEVLTYHGGLSTSQREEVIQSSERACLPPASYRDIGSDVDKLLKAALPEAKQLPLDCCANIQQFMGPKHTVLLAQIQCAGTGLNLQHMDRVIFTTPWWTAALMDQAAGRVLRLGQTKQVEIHYVSLSEEEQSSLNIDTFIGTRVEEKRTLCQALLDAASHAV